PRADLPCYTTAGSLGAAPSLDLARVVWPDGSTANAGDRGVAVYQATPIVTTLSPVPGGKNFMDVLRDAEKTEKSTGVGSPTFRRLSAVKQVVEH
ncbi:unnamed protein product, partial [Ectocarpus sp. 8 AP-2014]